MINVEDALSILKENIGAIEGIIVDLKTARGSVLSKDVLSPIDQPSFNQSAMDGYAFNFDDSIQAYQIIGEVAAGSSYNPKLALGEGVRIFTGGMVPDDANIVVQQEWITREEDHARITEKVAVGRNIRLKGEQIKTGSLALEKGTVLTPAGIGFLMGLGITAVEVVPQPSIGIITTGNELVEAGKVLLPGQIYESNSGMIAAALEQCDFENHSVATVSDDYQATKSIIESGINAHHVLILTGGISVGDYDFVGKALNELEVDELFYKINQKPGKPIYAGKKGKKLIFALPGNPAAALTCFYMYVFPALNQLKGKGFNGLEKLEIEMGEDYGKKGNRAEFLKAKIKNRQVYVQDMQSSAMLRSFAVSDALVFIPSTTDKVAKGDFVMAYKLN